MTNINNILDLTLPNANKFKANLFAQIEEIKQNFQAGRYQQAENQIQKILKDQLTSINDLDWSEQYELFIILGDIYLTKTTSIQIENLENYVKAAGIYQYCAHLIDKLESDSQPAKQKEIEERIFSVEKKLISDFSIANNDILPNSNSLNSYIAQLKELRSKVLDQLTLIEADHKTSNYTIDNDYLLKHSYKIKEIYRDTQEFFAGPNGLINDLIQDCEYQLGAPPAKASIILFGSFSAEMATPWSDIEWAILLPSNLSDALYNQTKDYYKIFATLMHIKIINFGETPLRLIGVETLNNYRTGIPEDDWFYDNIIKAGFSFDGPYSYGCKTPFGRKNYIGHAEFELIGTAEEIALLQNDHWYAQEGKYFQSLLHSIFVYGNQELHNDYQNELNKILDAKVDNQALTIKEFRALEVLQEYLKQFPADVTSEDKEGALLKLKREIYRFTHKAFESLDDLFNLHINNSWEVITNLYYKFYQNNCYEQNIAAMSFDEWHQSLNTSNDPFLINQKNSITNLTIALTISAQLRLQAYAHHQSHDEVVSVLINSYFNDEDSFNEISILHNTNLLHRYYRTIIPLQNLLLQGKNNKLSINKLFNDSNFYDNSEIIEALIDIRLMKYTQAKIILTTYSKNDNITTENYHCVSQKLGNVNLKLGQFTEAYHSYEAILLSIEQQTKINHLDVDALINLYNSGKVPITSISLYQSTLDSIGFVFLNDNKINQAELYYLKSSSIVNVVLAKNNVKLADSFNSLGNLYFRIEGKIEQSINYYSKALAIRCNNPQIKSPLDCLNSHHNIARAYLTNDDYEKAKYHFYESLKLKKTIFGNNHPLLADTYLALSDTYSKTEDLSNASLYLSLAVKINVNNLGVEHYKTIDSISELGFILFSAHHLEKASLFAQIVISNIQINHPNLIHHLQIILLVKSALLTTKLKEMNIVEDLELDSIIKNIGEFDNDADSFSVTKSIAPIIKLFISLSNKFQSHYIDDETISCLDYAYRLSVISNESNYSIVTGNFINLIRLFAKYNPTKLKIYFNEFFKLVENHKWHNNIIEDIGLFTQFAIDLYSSKLKAEADQIYNLITKYCENISKQDLNCELAIETFKTGLYLNTNDIKYQPLNSIPPNLSYENNIQNNTTLYSAYTFYKAIENVHSKQYQIAIDLLQKLINSSLITNDSDNLAIINFRLGTVLYKIGDYENSFIHHNEAEKHLQNVTYLQQLEFGLNKAALGLAAIKLNKIEQAKQYCDIAEQILRKPSLMNYSVKWHELDGLIADCYVIIGGYYLQQDLYPMAVDYFKKTDLCYKNPNSHMKKIEDFLIKDYIDDNIEHCKGLLQLNPKNFLVRFNLGFNYFLQGNKRLTLNQAEQAKQSFEKSSAEIKLTFVDLHETVTTICSYNQCSIEAIAPDAVYGEFNTLKFITQSQLINSYAHAHCLIHGKFAVVYDLL